MLRRDILKYGVAALALSIAAPAFADAMADAQAVVDKYATKQDKWDGPTTGPKARRARPLSFLAAI